MDDVAMRIVLVAGVIGLALIAGRLATRWQQPTQPPVTLSGLGLAPGIVVFTSTQCDNCKRVMAMLGTLDVPIREVTHELEPALFDSARVGAVPLVVVTDPNGRIVRQLAGTPSKTSVRRALRRAGWA